MRLIINKLKKIKLKKLTNILIIILIFFPANNAISQTMSFSQFYSSPMIIAPSFAGMTSGSRISMNYRDQWPKVPGTFVTYAVSYDQFFSRMKSGIGLIIVRDQAGSGNLGLIDIGLQYSYNIKIDRKWRVRPGLHFRYAQRSLNFQKLIFSDQISGTNISPTTIETNPIKSTGYIDVATSVLVYSNLYWGGIGVDHLLQPNQSLMGQDAKLKMKFSIFGGVKVPLRASKRRRRNVDVENVTFSMLYRNQGGYDQLDIGAYWRKLPFTLGLWFRGIPVLKPAKNLEAVDALIVLVGYKIFDLSFGYSYDFTVSRLISSTGGAHELSIIYEFNKDLKMEKNRRRVVIPCPSF